MYTEFYFKATLKKTTPDNIIKLIQSIITFEYSSYFMKDGYRNIRRESTYSKEIEHDYYIDLGITHPFLDCPRVEQLFLASDSGEKAYSFYQNQQGALVLEIDTYFKNYDNEIELFLDFIKPWVQIGRRKQKFLGWHRYEEADDRTYLHLINETNEIKETHIINYTNKVSILGQMYAKAEEKRKRKALKRLEVGNLKK